MINTQKSYKFLLRIEKIDCLIGQFFNPNNEKCINVKHSALYVSSDQRIYIIQEQNINCLDTNIWNIFPT